MPSNAPPSPIGPTVPLTTIYTPPSTCGPPRVEFYPVLSASSFHWSLLNDRNCYVPGGNGDPASWHYTIWSPGVCPSGWTGSPATYNSGGVSTSYCCPSDLVLDLTRGASGVCLTSLAAWTENWGGTVTGVQPIPVQWASSDLNAFTPASAPLLQRNQLSAAAATITQTMTADPSIATATVKRPKGPHRTPSQPHYEGPSANTDLGILLGALLGAAVLGLAIWILIHFIRKKRKSRSASAPIELPHTSIAPGVLGPKGGSVWPWRSKRSPPAYGVDEQRIPQVDSQATALSNSEGLAGQTHTPPGIAEADSVTRAELGGGWYAHELGSSN